MSKISKISLLAAGLLIYGNALAHDFVVDKLYYSFISQVDKTVAISGYVNDIIGEVSIPSTVSHNNETYTVAMVGVEAFQNCSSLTSITIPNSVITIRKGAFQACSNLISVEIGSSVTTIENYAFDRCNSLTSLVIPNSITTIGAYAFCECSSLLLVKIPNSVMSIGNSAFSSCDKLMAINVDAENRNYKSEEGILYNKNLTTLVQCPGGRSSIEIPNSITTIGDSAFKGCNSLTSVIIPNSVGLILESAFYGCTNLTSVVIPNSVWEIGDFVFCNCINLTSVVIPSGIQTIRTYIFSGCSSLTSVTIPNSVTTIREGAFKNCSNLTSVTIPNSVKRIDYDAFKNCSSLTSIYCLASIPPTGDDICDANTYRRCTLYVPVDCKLIYEGDAEWRRFYNIVEYDFSGVERIALDETEVSLENGRIVVKGAETVDVYSIAGKLLYNGCSQSIPILSQGTYIVLVNGKTYKIAI